MAIHSWRKHLTVVLGESAVASSAATFVMVLELPVWAMFVSWIAFSTRGLNVRSGLINLVCVLIGMALGMGAAYLIAALSPLLGAYALTPVVIIVTAIALSLARVPLVNNLLGFFLGLMAYFASHLPPSLATFASLALVTAIGSLAGALAHLWQRRVNHVHQA
ncbi:hypothetical protein BK025_10315 [Sodalis sp. TME1]|nr:hypothetical protein BK025_10315 [Sodalis sp. TME1]